MSYRIHFTAQDLARTRIVDTPHPLLEVTIAARTLREVHDGAAMGLWRQQVRSRMDIARAGMLLELTPPRGWTPGFLHPLTRSGDLGEALDLARSTPKKLILEELSFIAEQQKLPRWAAHLHDDPSLLRQLFDSVNHVYERALLPYWPRIGTLLEADRALRAREFAAGGMERVLTGLCPQHLVWKPPVLEVMCSLGHAVDLHLNGSGMQLIPSWFGSRLPIIDPTFEPQPFLTYPARREAHTTITGSPTAPGTDGAAALRSLIGRTRAAVLLAIARDGGCTTTELARRVNISLASASEHTTVLRSAGLVTTSRHRNTALHTATATGIALLHCGAG